MYFFDFLESDAQKIQGGMVKISSYLAGEKHVSWWLELENF